MPLSACGTVAADLPYGVRDATLTGGHQFEKLTRPVGAAFERVQNFSKSCLSAIRMREDSLQESLVLYVRVNADINRDTNTGSRAFRYGAPFVRRRRVRFISYRRDWNPPAQLSGDGASDATEGHKLVTRCHH